MELGFPFVLLVLGLIWGFLLGRSRNALRYAPSAKRPPDELERELTLARRRLDEQERRLNKLIEALYAQQKLIENDQERIESIVRALQAHRN